jgi:uncharacterized membrane protein YhhN
MPDRQQIAPFRWTLLALAVISSAVHLLGLWSDNCVILGTTRGVTMPLIVAALIGFHTATRWYCPLIAAGLLISLAGDLFMADESKWFLHGLTSFLIAHLFYIAAFSLNRPAPGPDALSAIPFAIFGVVAFASLAGGVGDFFFPTLVYTIVISAMGWRAAARYIARKRDPSGLLALIGALAFIASDSMIAWNNFRQPFEWKQTAVMITYFGAQVLFGLSVLFDPPPLPKTDLEQQ